MTDPHIRMSDLMLCNNELPIVTCQGGLALPSKYCVLPKGHAGHHSDGAAFWRNVAWHNAELERRNLK